MTDDRAVSTVQTVLAETRWLPVPCPTEYLPALARDVLYALEKAGMEVVRPVPEPPQLDAVEKFIAERGEYVRVLKQCATVDADYWRWQGHAEARRQLTEALDGHLLPDGSGSAVVATPQEQP